MIQEYMVNVHRTDAINNITSIVFLQYLRPIMSSLFKSGEIFGAPSTAYCPISFNVFVLIGLILRALLV